MLRPKQEQAETDITTVLLKNFKTDVERLEAVTIVLKALEKALANLQNELK